MDPGLETIRPYLTDFGLAKSVATGSKLTRTGEAPGTPAYMSPEQARGEVSALAPATDVWGLGCVLYEMLAGRPPWQGDTAAAVLGSVLLKEPAPIRGLRPDAPPDLEKVLRVALAKRASARYADSGAFRDDLDRLLRGERPRAPLPGSGRRRLAAGLLVAAAAVAALAAWRPSPVVPALVARVDSAADAAVARARALRGSDPRKAAQLLREAIELEPDRHSWRLERGLLLWAAGDATGARAEWGAIPAGAPEVSRARLYAGLEAFFRLDGVGARAHLATSEGAQGDVGRLARGALRALEDRWNDAREAVRDIPGWEASLVRGYVENQDSAGDKPAGVREYERALADGIPFAWVHNNLGNARASQGDPAGALAEYDRALVLDPGLATAYVNRAGARVRQGDITAALRDFARALELDPRTVNAHFGRAIVREAQGDFAGAIEDYGREIEIAPRNADAYYNRARMRDAVRDFAGAIEDYGRALAADPRHAESYNNRGAARAGLGDLAGALSDYGQAIELDPRHADALANRGGVRRALGDPAGAAADFARALEVAPPDWPGRAEVEGYLSALRAAPGGGPRR